MTMKFYSTQIVKESSRDKGNVKHWAWNNTAVTGKNLITSFNNINAKVTDWANFIAYTPKLNGNAVLNYNTTYSTLFYDRVLTDIQHVDLQQVPFNTNRVGAYFRGCTNLRSVVNMNSWGRHLGYGFFGCSNFNFNVQLPSSLLTMEYTFQACTKLNQNIKIPKNLTSMKGAFINCTSLNQSISIPNKVVNMNSTFDGCTALSTRINILSTEVNGFSSTFNNTTKAKQVYIYYNYNNGVTTNTYLNVFSAWNGKNGVTIYNLGKAPW